MPPPEPGFGAFPPAFSLPYPLIGGQPGAELVCPRPPGRVPWARLRGKPCSPLARTGPRLPSLLLPRAVLERTSLPWMTRGAFTQQKVAGCPRPRQSCPPAPTPPLDGWDVAGGRQGLQPPRPPRHLSASLALLPRGRGSICFISHPLWLFLSIFTFCFFFFF